MESQVGDTLARPAQIVLAEEKLNAYSWKALAGSVIGYCMDGFDMLILGFMLVTISADLALGPRCVYRVICWSRSGGRIRYRHGPGC